MLAQNGVRHLASEEHKNAVDQVENAHQIQEDHDRQRCAAQNVCIRVSQIPAPIAERPSVGTPPSAAEIEMWVDYEQNSTSFTTGDKEEGIKVVPQRLVQQVDIFGLLDPKETAERLGFEGDEGITKDLLQIEAEDDFLAEIMVNAVQKEIRAEYRIPSIPCKSPLGNVFFINDPRTIIAQDWANLVVRAQMHVYPEILDDGVVREIWHTLKWRKNMDLDILSPMYDAGTAHYYVNKLARLKNGNFVVPVLWLMYCGKVHADVFAVSVKTTGHATIDDSKTIIVTASDFSENYLNLEDKNLIPQWSGTEGLSIHAIRANYIMQYAGSLIGWQFKTIVQTAVFHLHDLVTEDQFTAWKAVGELSALLWLPEIRDLTQYRNDLKIAVANVLNAVAQIDPSKSMTKIKYHLLTHIDFNAIQLGPLIEMATEIFESFNTVFRVGSEHGQLSCSCKGNLSSAQSAGD
ncbi:hypothetical protein K438DRAFT_1952791 [Mycena galopus ATCC 62051]|nr:hypothetical protein K438DRAFT_1952791 [Mycena galopus ATCC 62051]